MNTQSDTATMTAAHTLVFEPAALGGGSLWNGDSLLATLTVSKHTERQGRLSIRETNRTANLLSFPRRKRTSYRLAQDAGQTGEAAWAKGEPSALLYYRGWTYLVTRESLLKMQDHQPVVALALASDWHSKQMGLHIAAETDLALVAFFLFVAYDLRG